MQSLRKLPAVAVYALAMAYVESAVVAYLREMYGITDIAHDCAVPPKATPRSAATEVASSATKRTAPTRSS